MKEHNRKIIGVVPQAYQADLNDLACDEAVVTKNCTSRNLELMSRADAIIFLEGGIGTFQEILTAIEAKRTGEFDKPIVLINKYNYFAPLIKTFEQAYMEGFTSEQTRKQYFITSDVNEALIYIKNYGSEN